MWSAYCGIQEAGQGIRSIRLRETSRLSRVSPPGFPGFPVSEEKKNKGKNPTLKNRGRGTRSRHAGLRPGHPPLISPLSASPPAENQTRKGRPPGKGNTGRKLRAGVLEDRWLP